MKKDRTAVLATALLVSGLVIGSTGGAVAGAMIGTSQIQNGAVTTPKLHNDAVTSPKIADGTIAAADLESSAQGARIVQYSASGALLDSQDGVTVSLPGTWTDTSLGNSAWAVQLVRAGTSPAVFSLGQSGLSGEGPSDGWALNMSGSTALVHVNAPSYGSITTIRITRMIPTVRAGNGGVTRSAPRGAPAGG